MSSQWSHGRSLVLTALVGSALACGGPTPGANTAGGQQNLEAAENTSDAVAAPDDGGSTTSCEDHNDDGVCDNLNVDGRMTGGGTLAAPDGTKVSHGFELRCDAADHRQNLTVRWGRGNQFHLESLTSAICADLNEMSEGAPAAGFDTFIGIGTGRLRGGEEAEIQFGFTDAGEPGTLDGAAIVIRSLKGEILLAVAGTLTGGNQQAHRVTGNEAVATP